MSVPADIRDLEDQLDKVDEDAGALVAGLTEERGAWRQDPGSWSVAECLDHLATGNRVYLQAMGEPAVRARREGRRRTGPARPGFVGRLFVRWLEPPVKPRLIRGVRFSLATGLHVIPAHERRHLWQAWRVRRAAEQAATEV